jgi:hypothetical protein
MCFRRERALHRSTCNANTSRKVTSTQRSRIHRTTLLTIERLESIAPAGETPVQQAARDARSQLAETAKNDHIQRLTTSWKTAATTAEAELTRLEALPEGQATKEDLNQAHKLLDFCTKENVEWAPRVWITMAGVSFFLHRRSCTRKRCLQSSNASGRRSGALTLVLPFNRDLPQHPLRIHFHLSISVLAFHT